MIYFNRIFVKITVIPAAENEINQSMRNSAYHEQEKRAALSPGKTIAVEQTNERLYQERNRMDVAPNRTQHLIKSEES